MGSQIVPLHIFHYLLEFFEWLVQTFVMHGVICFLYKIIWTYMINLCLCLLIYYIHFCLITCLLYTPVLRLENIPLLLSCFLMSDLPYLNMLYSNLYCNQTLFLGIFLSEHNHTCQNMFLLFCFHQILYLVCDCLFLLGC